MNTLEVRDINPLGSRDMNLICDRDMNMNALKDGVVKRGVKRPAEDEGGNVFVKRERYEENQDDGDCWRPW